MVNNLEPELLEESLRYILSKAPDVVAFSIVYSSQAFYAYALLKELKKQGIKTGIGGPCINNKLKGIADVTCSNEVVFLEYILTILKYSIDHNALKTNRILDFSIYNLEDYFTFSPVLSLKTSNSCYYKQCTFCTHHGNAQYREHSLEDIKKTIVKSQQKYFFLVDEMIPKNRLLEIAELLKPLNIIWMCQLRPTKDLDKTTLETLRKAGLKAILWGVESASDRILQLMKKGTNKKDISLVINNAKEAGITNVTYIMFGFPTETKEEFIETIDFLKAHEKSIDLISPTIFGLQKDAPMFNKPEQYGITQIITEQRTILEPKITYKLSQGLSHEQVIKLSKAYKQTLQKINKFPKEMNFFREHMLVLL
ncbi:radical SAM protein [Candidatus Woesearchaeota archaeon]|nr:radical SAM protein [Candidatus Woesearchaeota archaeon]